MPKTLSEIETDAITLHGLCQGAEELLVAVSDTYHAAPARNALSALLEVMTERARRLADDLGDQTSSSAPDGDGIPLMERAAALMAAAHEPPATNA